MKLKIYTDGACSGNPGKGGWAAIILDKNNQFSLSGSENNTTNNRIHANWIAPFTSPNESQDLKIPVVKVFTPKYLTAPYSFNTSIITKNKPEKIAGLDNGSMTLKKVWIFDNPKLRDILI